MLLITDANSLLGRENERLLLLGEWCKLFFAKSVLTENEYEILPYHWNDRKRLHQDFRYLDALYEKYLVELKDFLNRIHGVSYSLRYWRILIGPWLYGFISVLYDRYLSILIAIKSKKVSNTFIKEYSYRAWLPTNYPEFLSWSFSDQYNHYIYGEIIKYFGELPYQNIPAENSLNSINSADYDQYKILVKRKILQLIGNLSKLVPDDLNRHVIVKSYFNVKDLIKLQISLKQIPYLASPEVEISKLEFDFSIREKIWFEPTNCKFEDLLRKILNKQLPLIYLEGYSRMHKASISVYPKKTKSILTANAYHADEGFKFWAAYQTEKGTKLFGTQHGGHYGTAYWSSTERHQIKICDKFFTWGWTTRQNSKVAPLAAIKLMPARKIKCPKKNGKILMVTMALPRFFYYMYSVPVAATSMKSYFNDLFCFVQNLSENNRKLLMVRLYQHDYDWNQKARWLERFSDIEFYEGNKSVIQNLSESRLLIGTYNATTILEALAADMPTVMFWNPNHWELNSKALPYFNRLRCVGILHDSPESAAKLVNNISADPELWWHKQCIQKTVKEFCHQFARTSHNWMAKLRKEFNPHA